MDEDSTPDEAEVEVRAGEMAQVKEEEDQREEEMAVGMDVETVGEVAEDAVMVGADSEDEEARRS